jgi:5S rRNA maturation endonuclease (ribonuclease M5)
MRKSSGVWQRVSRRRPCPVCEKPDWCLFAGEAADPDAAICARIESGRRCGEAGWLHVLHTAGPTWTPWRRSICVAARMMQRGGDDVPDFTKLAADFRAAVRPDALDHLAVGLGVSAASLTQLGIGWAEKHRAWAFPMLDPAGDVLGIRLRLHSGKKLSVRGGREGLFLPSPHPNPLPMGEGTGASLATNHSPLASLIVCEGPTDTAAMLDLGFHAVGRPSCTGGVKLLVGLVANQRPAGVVIVADADAPGRRGAEMLAAALTAYCREVRVIVPPAGVKDAREWKRSGATAADVQAAIHAAEVRKLAIAATIRRKAGVRHGR